jgi:hypothetical protein
MPSRSLAAPASISARPRLACPSRRGGNSSYDKHLLAHRLLLSYSKLYISTSLYTGEVDVILTIAEYRSF